MDDFAPSVTSEVTPTSAGMYMWRSRQPWCCWRHGRLAAFLTNLYLSITKCDL